MHSSNAQPAAGNSTSTFQNNENKDNADAKGSALPRKQSLLPIDEHNNYQQSDCWVDSNERRQMIHSIQSPDLFPISLFGSPDLQPNITPSVRPVDEDFSGISQTFKRKRSDANDFIDDQRLFSHEDRNDSYNMKGDLFKSPFPAFDNSESRRVIHDKYDSNEFSLPPPSSSANYSSILQYLESADMPKPPSLLNSLYSMPKHEDNRVLKFWPKEESNENPISKLDETGKKSTEKMIGQLSAKERKEKIEKYLKKRKRRTWNKKVSYNCRKKVADKRLRIKGRFVTREQAYAILGTTEKDLSNNELLMRLVKANADCSIVTSAQNMKIRNIQTLITPQTSQKRKLSAGVDDSNLKVEILKQNQKDQIVEIKIEKHSEGNSQEAHELAGVSAPIFSYGRVPERAQKKESKTGRKEVKKK